MKKEQLFYTFHDELFYQLALPKTKVKEGGASLKLTNESELLTTQELFLIMILLDHYKKNDGLGVPISFRDIQVNYRNKRLGKSHYLPRRDYVAYVRALNGLQDKWINLDVKQRKRYHIKKTKYDNNPLLRLHASRVEGGNIVFEYALGEFGDVLLQSKRFSDIIPIDIIRLSYQQITAVYLALYLSRLIFINKRKKNHTFTITVNSLIENVMIHKKNGMNTGKTLNEILLDDISNKYTYITTFKKHLSYVLNLFIRDGVIQTYKVIPMELDEISIKNYKKGKLQIVIKD